MTLPQKIELYANGTAGKRAVEDLAHITASILDNISEGRSGSELTAAIVEQAIVSFLAEFDAELGKHKTIKRFLDTSIYTPFPTEAAYIAPSNGSLSGEVLLLAQPLAYAVLRLRRMVVDSQTTVTGATVRVISNGTQVLSKSVNLVVGLNKIDLDLLIDADVLPLRISMGVVGASSLRPIQDEQLSGLIRRATTTEVTAQTQWELYADMRKLADDYASELEEAFWYKCGITVLNWHLKSQAANRSTIVGREEIAANKTELIDAYEIMLRNAVKKIVEVLEKKPVTKSDLRFDRAYGVGSMV
jgi:hypothetical protein